MSCAQEEVAPPAQQILSNSLAPRGRLELPEIDRLADSILIRLTAFRCRFTIFRRDGPSKKLATRRHREHDSLFVDALLTRGIDLEAMDTSTAWR